MVQLLQPPPAPVPVRVFHILVAQAVLLAVYLVYELAAPLLTLLVYTTLLLIVYIPILIEALGFSKIITLASAVYILYAVFCPPPWRVKL
jgi:hypothetical protein